MRVVYLEHRKFLGYKCTIHLLVDYCDAAFPQINGTKHYHPKRPGTKLKGCPQNISLATQLDLYPFPAWRGLVSTVGEIVIIVTATSEAAYV
jgi:hypothetical protein